MRTPLSRRQAWLLLALLVALAVGRVAATARTFSQVIDEPVHIAAGYDWLTRGAYDVDSEHPPLARILAALPLMSLPSPSAEGMPRGTALLGRGNDYVRNLQRARLGNLLLLAVAIISVYAWAARHLGRGRAFVAALLFSTLPPILGHAGVATTDLAAAATLPLAMLTLEWTLDAPTPRRAALLGLAIGLGVLSKFSFLVFFPLCAVTLLVVRRTKPKLLMIAVSLAVAFLLAWAGYRFRVSRLTDVYGRADELAAYALHGSHAAAWAARHVPLPVPELVIGILQLRIHELHGHPAFLLGQTSERGWWYYFPLALAVKTPIPLLLLALAALAWGRRSFALFAAVMLAVVMLASINIGVRHILPLYAPLAILAASLARFRTAMAALVVWQLASTTLAHPNYIAWFNAFAGAHPERVLGDSNLDWGQDAGRLARQCRKLGITNLGLGLFTSADLDALGFPPYYAVPADVPASGWVALSESFLQRARAGNPNAFAWAETRKPEQHIGGTIRLYHIR
jgi:4-amino-4-deoxy-L-arabinose transferase-like glycosyltransferase